MINCIIRGTPPGYFENLVHQKWEMPGPYSYTYEDTYDSKCKARVIAILQNQPSSKCDNCILGK